jgi:SulP family sulfate permease
MLKQLWKIITSYFLRPVTIFRSYDRGNLRPDLIAGLTTGIVALPQAIAYAMIAELPPQYGLYTAIIASIIGALWGSSYHLNTGPTNTISLLVLATLLPLAEVGTDNYLVIAGLLAVMVGIFQIGLGIARLGVLVNFVSDSVVIGFTAGAGVLIGLNQIRHLLRLDIPSHASLFSTSSSLIKHASEVHWNSLYLGIGILVVIILIKKITPKLPAALFGMIIATAFVGGFKLDQIGIYVIGQMPISLPPLVDLPLFDLALIGQLSTGALAVGAISLVESVAISRSIASQSGQHLDSNQEFIGQGFANLVSGFFSGFAVSGSFTRTAVNYEAGAKTSVASIISGVFILIAVLVFAPLASFLPRAALASVLLVTAYGMIDRSEIVRIWRGARGDAAIMVITFLATLFLPLQFAVLTGILISFAVYIMGTSVPRVLPVLPVDNFSHFAPRPNLSPCPQLAIFDIFGDLYFGASSHIEEEIHKHLEAHPTQRFLLLRMTSVNQIDISGVHILESVTRELRKRGGDVFMMRTQPPAIEIFKSTGFFDYLGEDHFLSYGDAIGHLFNRILDPSICIYECDVRVFVECQNLPRPKKLPNEEIFLLEMPSGEVMEISPLALWDKLHDRNPPIIVDIREPREYLRGHIPQAISIPLFKLISDTSQLPKDNQVVLVCRSGRRSTRAIYMLNKLGYTNLQILEGGMLAWENAGLINAIETKRSP